MGKYYENLDDLIDLIKKIDQKNLLAEFILECIQITKQQPEKNTIYTNSVQSWTEAVNDTLLYGNMEVMEKYQNMYLELFELWEEVAVWNSAEHLLYKYLMKKNLLINSDLKMLTHNDNSYKIRKPK